MNPSRDYLALGQLDRATEEAAAAVRNRPTDLDARLLLLDLYCLNARWERAGNQLDVLESMETFPASGIASYRVLIAAEQARTSFSASGSPSPSWIIEPPDWAADHLEGLARLRQGDAEAARDLLLKSEGARPPITGRLGGLAFEEFRDLDDALGPFLEVVTQQGLSYALWEDVRFLDVPPPAIARDFLWAPARLALNQGPIGKVYLPALYPGSSADPEGPIRLGRETRWRDLGSGIVSGIGLKMFLVGNDSVSLFELRELAFGPDASGVESPL